jgi:hypothetical protein
MIAAPPPSEQASGRGERARLTERGGRCSNERFASCWGPSPEALPRPARDVRVP